MTVTATAVQNAIRDIILGISPSIIPQTTLSAQASSGATSITLTDASHFVPTGLIFFDDALGEKMQTASAISGSTVTLDFTGTPETSLTQTHTAGTAVYTNLMTEIPQAIGRMLDKGDPFIFVTVLDERETRRTTGLGSQKVYVARIQYHRTLIRPDDQLMNPNRWAYQQQESARADLDTISATLRANQSLNAVAVMLGDAGRQGSPLMTRSWRKLAADRDTQTFVAALDVTVTGSVA